MTKAEFMEMMDWAKEQTTSDIVKALRETEYRGYMKAIADRPQGEWIIEKDTNGNTYGRCSICGMKQYAGQLNYCPDCGTKMKGAVNESID